jgi:hypothetical protein
MVLPMVMTACVAPPPLELGGGPSLPLQRIRVTQLCLGSTSRSTGTWPTELLCSIVLPPAHQMSSSLVASATAMFSKVSLDTPKIRPADSTASDPIHHEGRGISMQSSTGLSSHALDHVWQLSDPLPCKLFRFCRIPSF